MKNYLTLLVIREMKAKTMKYLSLTGLANIAENNIQC